MIRHITIFNHIYGSKKQYTSKNLKGFVTHFFGFSNIGGIYLLKNIYKKI